MKKILITGGAGYIGSVLTKALLDKGYEVTVLDNFLFKQPSLLNCCHSPKFHIIRGDCRNTELLKNIIQEFDIIIPLAAIVGAPLCKLDPFQAKSVNYEAIVSLMDLKEENQLVLYPTTNSGYGVGTENQFCTEVTPLNPISLYGKTKADAEIYVLSKPNTITFRLATVFGSSPRMRLDLLVNDFVYRAVNDRAVVLFEAHFKRNYIHIQDVATAFIHAIENSCSMVGESYNLGLESANLSKYELCEQIQRHIPEFTFLESEIGEDPDKRDYIVSNQKILATGYKPQNTLDMGIEELIKVFNIIKVNPFSNV